MSRGNEQSDRTQIGAPAKPSQKVTGKFQASVVIIQGHAAGMEYPLSKAYTVIGRDKEADIVVKDPLVSRQHVVIVYHDGKYVLKDLDSTNGTQLKGANVKQADLRHGDKFRVGDTTLQFILEETRRGRTFEIG